MNYATYKENYEESKKYQFDEMIDLDILSIDFDTNICDIISNEYEMKLEFRQFQKDELNSVDNDLEEPIDSIQFFPLNFNVKDAMDDQPTKDNDEKNEECISIDVSKIVALLLN